MDDMNIDSTNCVSNRLRRHGAYDLAGRVAALFCHDSLFYFLIQEKVKTSNQRAMKSLILLEKRF
jgi:hypothetical protein